MADNILYYRSDNLIELRGPVNAATDAAIDSGATVTALLYNADKDAIFNGYTTKTTVDAAASDVAITVQDSTPFAVGEPCKIRMDNGVDHYFGIISLPGSDVLGFAAQGLAYAASAGALVTRLGLTTSLSGSTHLSISDWSGWEENDAYEIESSAKVITTGTLSQINRDRNYALMSTAPLGTAALGALVKCPIITTPITLASYGTFPTSNPVAGDPTWGFRGTIDHNQIGLYPGMRVRAEITAVDGTLNLERKVISRVVNA